MRRNAITSRHNSARAAGMRAVFSAERSRMLLMLMGSFRVQSPALPPLPFQPRRSQKALARSPAWSHSLKQMPPAAQTSAVNVSRAFLARLAVYTVQRVRAFVCVTGGKRLVARRCQQNRGRPQEASNRKARPRPQQSSGLSGTIRAPFQPPVPLDWFILAPVRSQRSSFRMPEKSCFLGFFLN